MRQKLGKDTKRDEKAARRNYEQQPLNPIHAYCAGEYEAAAELLLTNPIWPNDRQPTSFDCKELWPMEREMETLKPGTEIKIHPGGDFIFVASLILKRYNHIA